MQDVNDTPLALGDARLETLEHGLALILESWRGFDHARPYQPPITERTHALLSEGLPETGVGPHAALDEVGELLDESLAQVRPRFFGYVGSSGLELGVLADALAASHDINLAASAAAADLVERQTLRWVGDFVGFPAASGAFTSGGMLSNLTALTAARERAQPGSAHQRLRRPCDASTRPSRRTRASSAPRGARLRAAVAADDRDRLEAGACAPTCLAAAIEHDIADGRVPVAVVATAGTTLTGAVDPIRAVAEVCARHGVWLHVDGAYGLPAALDAVRAGAVRRARARRLGRRSTRTSGCSCPRRAACSGAEPGRSRGHVLARRAVHPRHRPGRAPAVDRTLEYSRPFRALKLWLALRAHGAAAFRDAHRA